MEKVKIFAPATFCFGKNRSILTIRIEHHRLMCNHFWKTLITSNNEIEYMSYLRLFFFHYLHIWYLWFRIQNQVLSKCTLFQGGRTWQPFVGGKNGQANFRQARIYNFWVKCVVFARNHKFAKLTQWNMQYIPCNSALLAQETLFLTQKGTFLTKDLQKSA